MKKETTTEKYIKKAVEEATKKFQHTTVKNCTMSGVTFNAKASDAISDIADALCTNAEACVENAKALKQLSYVLKATGVEVDAFIKIGPQK